MKSMQACINARESGIAMIDGERQRGGEGEGVNELIIHSEKHFQHFKLNFALGFK